jgi:putative oxidoreductase
MKESQKHMFGHTLLRVTIGLLFFIAGIKKLMNPDGIIGMLGGLGFPAPLFFGWVLILAEVIFGALIFIGYKVRYNAWPLAIILAVAVLFVTIPNEGFASGTFYFHLISIAGLITIALTGPGNWAVSKVR